jgi:hypothetical protein
MRFLIQYLKETTEEHSVCAAHAIDVSTLHRARTNAWSGVFAARRSGATGFQIRDRGNVIVAIEEFDVGLESLTLH